MTATQMKHNVDELDYAAACQLEQTRVVELAAARALVASLEARWAEGDDSATTEEAQAAALGETRATLLLDAAKNFKDATKKEADRRNAADSPTIAVIVAKLLTDNAMSCGLYRIPVHVIAGYDQEQIGNLERPGVLVHQSAPAAYDAWEGHFTGSVEISALVENGAPGIDLDKVALKIADLAYDQEHRVNVQPRAGSIRVDFISGAAAIPLVLLNLEPFRISRFGQALAARVARSMSALTRAHGVHLGAGDAASRVALVKAYPEGFAVQSNEAGADHLVRRVVTGFISVEAPRDIELGWIRDQTRTALESAAGTFAHSMGRIESVDVNVKPEKGNRTGADVTVVLFGRLG